mmetsp:Transcript_12775/g.26642  ORF Transcript_12775/g.26642 Transcript_12775/m.26642 type:complete len:367 (-) Transcript_12775:549-1649(-)
MPSLSAHKILAARGNSVAAAGCGCAVVAVLLVALVVPAFRTGEGNALALSFGGYCTKCGVHHVLRTTDEARRAATDLRDRMVRSGRVDIDELPAEQRELLLLGRRTEDGGDDSCGSDAGSEGLDPALATERLYERRGKMFGVLVCEAPSHEKGNGEDPAPDGNNLVVLKAYAGKLGGQWNLKGWAPLVGRVPEEIPEFRRMSAEVTELFEQIDELGASGGTAEEEEEDEQKQQQRDHEIKRLTKERSRISTLCIEEIRKHQVLTNFKGESLPIKDIFLKGPTKLPGGTGDCAAPKLIAEAVRRGLTPTGICEVFVGATGGMSTTKGDGEFYDACEQRCEQIAGHMLCGLVDDENVGGDRPGPGRVA